MHEISAVSPPVARDHATHGEEYEVSAGIDGNHCVIEVVDRGEHEFDGEPMGRAEASPSAESGLVWFQHWPRWVWTSMKRRARR